ncbi:hypothetical protein [Metabacillus sediminilitoris]|uniref:hypothetical protein n=1 Tax=Metabacillus sediminilitoris TaxID=2567941 RepID=UPI0010A47C5E|nr:hypothetical protein [Metabacillus sediminilitoris]
MNRSVVNVVGNIRSVFAPVYRSGEQDTCLVQFLVESIQMKDILICFKMFYLLLQLNQRFI